MNSRVFPVINAPLAGALLRQGAALRATPHAFIPNIFVDLKALVSPS